MPVLHHEGVRGLTDGYIALRMSPGAAVGPPWGRRGVAVIQGKGRVRGALAGVLLSVWRRDVVGAAVGQPWGRRDTGERAGERVGMLGSGQGATERLGARRGGR